jgi:hypothetical protein
MEGSEVEIDHSEDEAPMLLRLVKSEFELRLLLGLWRKTSKLAVQSPQLS